MTAIAPSATPSAGGLYPRRPREGSRFALHAARRVQDGRVGSWSTVSSDGRRVARIMTGDHLKQDRNIGDGSRDWSDAVLAVSDRDDPERLVKPTVGLRPTTPFADAGLRIDPSVSVPSAAAARLAEQLPPTPSGTRWGDIEGIGIEALPPSAAPPTRGPQRAEIGPRRQRIVGFADAERTPRLRHASEPRQRHRTSVWRR